VTASVVDCYPTRSCGSTGIESRVDPVVWAAPDGSYHQGPLDRQAVDGFASDGFLAVDRLLDADVVADLRAELDALRADPVLADDERSVASPIAVRSVRSSRSTC
jgi:ectoine hydroxylase